MNKSIILNQIEISQRIKRISFQILESNYEATEIIIAGIKGNGYVFAKKIYDELSTICAIDLKLCEVIIDKKKPLSPISTSLSKSDYENKNLVLIDDVLNSGKTLIYGVKHFLEVNLNNFKTVVLIDRNHKKYPVKADFKGLSLSTSLQEHIEVDFENEEGAIAYLCDLQE